MSSLFDTERNIYAAGLLVVSLLAVHFVAHRNQAIRIAGAALPQPTPPATPPKATPKTPPPSFLKRAGQQVWSIGKVLIHMSTPAIVMNYILPKLGSQKVTDGAALLFYAYMMYLMHHLSCVAFENGVTWIWSDKRPYLSIISQPPWSKWTPRAFATTLTCSLIGLIYYEYTYLAFVFVAFPLFGLGISPHRMSMKDLCKFATFVVGGTLTICAAIFAGITLWYFYGSASKSPEEATPKTTNTPSQWIFMMLTPIIPFVSIWLPSMFLTITLRFDAAQSGGVRLEENDAPKVEYRDEKAIARIPRHRANPSTPMYNAGMVILAATQILAFIGTMWIPVGPKGDGLAEYQIGLFSTMLTVPLGLAFWAWYTGCFKEWYGFEEKSLYLGDETIDTEAMDDVENLLDEKH